MVIKPTQVPSLPGGSVSPNNVPVSVAYSPDGRAIAAGLITCGQIIYCKD